MNKRKFLKQTTLMLAGIYIAPSILLSSCKSESKKNKITESVSVTPRIFKLPELLYGYNAFPETIDPLTMEIHYTKHHQGYTDNLNSALEQANISGKTIEEILRGNDLPDVIRNNGGGYFNHNLYWDILTPGGTMSNSFRNKIIKDFGSVEVFMKELAEVGSKRFGSGWVWVVQDNNRKLNIFSTPNQDNPLMKVVSVNGTPILGIDVWEHAYYLKYQNKRTEYLQNILNIINWDKVEARMI